MKFVIYTRASTDRDNTISHEMQVSDCRKLAGENEILHFPEDDVSGDADLAERPQLMAAINALKKGDILLVWKLNRLARDPYRQAMIIALVQKKRASLQSYIQQGIFEETAEAELQRNLFASIAKYELETIRHNVKRAMKSAKEAGRCVGQIPYGYSYFISPLQGTGKMVKWLYPDEKEQRIILEMERLQSEGLTYREISEALNMKGVRNRSGHPWKHSAVWRVLKSRGQNKGVCYQAKPPEAFLYK